MKKYTLFGNCQAQAMRWLFTHIPEFSNEYEYVEVKASYEMDESDAISFYEDIIPNLDLLFMHPHSFNRSKWHEHSVLSGRALECGVKLIRFPQVIYMGYNPFECLTDFNFDPSIPKDIVHFDTMIFKAVINNWNVDQLQSHIKSNHDYYCKVAVAVEKYAIGSIKHLEIQRKCDFFVSDYFEQNFRTTRLMHDVNHPTAILMNRVCTQLLQSIDPSWSSEFDIDVFNDHDSLVYPVVKEALGLEFETSLESIYKKLGDYYAFFHGQNDEAKRQLIEIHDKHYKWVDHLTTL